MSKKRALVLSGGGSKGAFEVGVLKYLLGDKKTKYDIITGVSVGAINASYMAQFPIGKEIECIIQLENLWDSLSSENVYDNHFPLGKAEALWKPSVYDSKPLKKIVYENLNEEKIKNSGKKLCINAVSLTTGELKTWTEKDRKNIKNAVLASSAFPVMFNPIEINGELYTDAGVKDIAPLNAAIKAGAEIIDIIITSPLGSQPWKPKRKKPNTIDVLIRSLDLMTDEILANDLIKMEKINCRVKDGKAEEHHKYIEYTLYQPSHTLTNNSLDFSQKNIQKMKKEGYELATNKNK